MKNLIAFAAVLVALLISAVAPCAAQPSITVEIVNNSGQTPDNVYVLLTYDPTYPFSVSGITGNTSTQLSALVNNQFTLSAISSGRIIFSYGAAVAANQQPTTPSARFDKVELTYPGAANLTAVDFFGIPFKLETLDASGNVLQTLTYYTSTNSLNSTLLALAPNAIVQIPQSDATARILSPELSPSSYPSMQGYVNSVANQKVEISGTYVGPVAPSPNNYNYTGTFGDNGSITLSGTMTQSATPPGEPLNIDGTTLASAIYTCNGSYTVDTATNNPQQVTNNDVYAAIYRDVVAGFNFGYMGGNYGTNSASWYGTTPYNPPYACARKTNDGYFNQYASIIAANSDAYGFPFSDVNQPVQVGLNAGVGPYYVATLRITILPDDMVDAPIIQSATPGNDSITVNWDSISGATDYTVLVSPPIPAQTYDAGTSTSYTVSNLSGGTPYTVSVTASNGTSTSAAMPLVVSTTGSVTPAAGPATWHFVPNFTGTFPSGHTITFNGVAQALPTGANPAMQFNNVSGQVGQENSYVFEWTDQNNNLVFSSVLYVQLDGTTSTGMGIINPAQTVTFMAANQYTPTYDQTGFNLYLSIAPNSQRTLCPVEFRDPSPTIFCRVGDLMVLPADDGRRLTLKGTAKDGDGLRGIALTVTTKDGQKRTYPAKVFGSSWTATVRTFGSTGKLPVDVTAVDRKGNVKKHSYLVKIPAR